MKELNELRKAIDSIDEQVQTLLAERAVIALKVGETKCQEKDPVFYRPEREAEILSEVMKRNKGPLKNEDLVDIYKKVISSCLALEKSLKIAFLGPEGSFSHEATKKQFGDKIDLKPATTLKNVFSTVECGDADYALVPIENSTEGIVNQTLDLLAQTPLAICGELIIPIHHHLLSRCDDVKHISQVYSHPQALLQCREWLEKHLPNDAALMPVNSTSQACMLASKEATTAAVAGEITLERYHLNVLAKNIEDEPNNSTRFYILGNQTTKITDNDKTTMLIWIPHQAGSLAKLLHYFSKNNINLTMIESRPYAHKIWEYIFFFEMEGHQEDARMLNMVEQLKDEEITFKLLGSYRKAL